MRSLGGSHRTARGTASGLTSLPLLSAVQPCCHLSFWLGPPTLSTTGFPHGLGLSLNAGSAGILPEHAGRSSPPASPLGGLPQLLPSAWILITAAIAFLIYSICRCTHAAVNTAPASGLVGWALHAANMPGA